MNQLKKRYTQHHQKTYTHSTIGNRNLAAKEAGYKDSPSLVNQTNELIWELSGET